MMTGKLGHTRPGLEIKIAIGTIKQRNQSTCLGWFNFDVSIQLDKLIVISDDDQQFGLHVQDWKSRLPLGQLNEEIN